ncbi:MAG: hypothetical protein PHX24_02190 [Acidithiobacillus sp.]|nr:hypothetical protein [Acidithiobacillus sp.]
MQVHESRVSVGHNSVKGVGIHKRVVELVSGGYLHSMTIRDIHIENLKILINRYGSLPALLNRVVEMGEQPINEKYLKNVLAGWTGPDRQRIRDIGPSVCRRLERAIGEAEGWMDVSHSPQFLSGSDAPMLSLALESLLSPKELALLGNFRRMASHQQDALIRESEEVKRTNEKIIAELAADKLSVNDRR